MIETKILGDAVGVQRQDVIDKSETTVLPSLSNGVIAGNFKRGRMDKPFKVTASNYKALLGHDPSNPSYLAVEDCFKQGVSEISVLRVGQTGGGGGGAGETGETGGTGGGAGGDAIDWDSLPNQSTVRIINKEGNLNNTYMYFSVEINGVLYNAEKLDLSNYDNLSVELRDLVSFNLDSGGTMYVSANVDSTELKVRLSPSEEQKVYSKDFYTSPWDENPTPQGLVLPNGDFLFRLYR